MNFIPCVVSLLLSLMLYIPISNGVESTQNACTTLLNNDEYAQAHSICMKEATMGDVHAQFALGEIYADGKGVSQDYNEAAKWYRKAAEQGDAEGQKHLGILYYDGKGVPQDYNLAAEWIRKAAEQGNAEGQNNLGFLYSGGDGVPQDYKLASEWYRKAADQGNAEGQNYLGVLYSFGKGVPQDDKLAAEWIRKAAEQGYAVAQNNLGDSYYVGDGVPQDYNLAAEWYRKAAEQGYAVAQNNLGILYDGGKGVPQDYNLAAQWYRKAAKQGNAESEFNLGYLYEEQGKDDGSQDDNLAAQWYRKAAEQGNLDAQKALGFRYTPNYSSQKGNPDFERCIGVAKILYANDKWDAAVNRVSACQRNILDMESYDDALLFLHDALEFSGDMLFSLNWIREPEKYKRQNEKYANFYLKYNAINYSLAYTDEDYANSHPIPLMPHQLVSNTIQKLEAIRAIEKKQKTLINRWYNQAGDVKKLMDYDSKLDARIKSLKDVYNFFIAYEMYSILNRTEQLLMIADEAAWIDGNDGKMREAAKIFARLNKNIILSSDEKARDYFLRVYSDFKSQAGSAQMEMLKAVQDLTESDLEHGGVDTWWETQ